MLACYCWQLLLCKKCRCLASFYRTSLLVFALSLGGQASVLHVRPSGYVVILNDVTVHGTSPVASSNRQIQSFWQNLWSFCVQNKEPIAIITFTGLVVYAAVKIISEDVGDQPTERALPQQNDPQLQELQSLADQQAAFGQQLQQLSGAITELSTSDQIARQQDSARLQQLQGMLQNLTTVVQNLQAPGSQQNIAQINQFNILNPPSNAVDRSDEFDQRITGLSGDIGDILQQLRRTNQKIQELEAKVIQDEITQGIVIARQDAAHRIQLCHQEMLNLLEKRIEDLKVENEKKD